MPLAARVFRLPKILSTLLRKPSCLDVAVVAEIHREVEEGGGPFGAMMPAATAANSLGSAAAAETEAERDVANVTWRSARLHDVATALGHGEIEAAVRSNEHVCAAAKGEAQGSRRPDIGLWGDRTGRGIGQAGCNGAGQESSGVGERGVANRNGAGEEPSGVRCAVA